MGGAFDPGMFGCDAAFAGAHEQDAHRLRVEGTQVPREISCMQYPGLGSKLRRQSVNHFSRKPARIRTEIDDFDIQIRKNHGE